MHVLLCFLLVGVLAGAGGRGRQGRRGFGGAASEAAARRWDWQEAGHRQEDVHPHPFAGLSPPDSGEQSRADRLTTKKQTVVLIAAYY